MKLGVMQPYFFPYIGYFQLVHSVDTFIIIDDVQYIRHGWINRNRILKPRRGWQYIHEARAPHRGRELLRNIHVSGDEGWKRRILRQVEHYRKRAPYYSAVMQLLFKCFDFKDRELAVLNAKYTEAICAYLSIETKINISSQINFDYSKIASAGDWALAISHQLGASEYINPLSGAQLFVETRFRERGIKLSLLKATLSEYDQGRAEFEPALSIIDVLMFNSIGAARGMLAKGIIREFGVLQH